VPIHLTINDLGTHVEIRLVSKDETNRLTQASVRELHDTLRSLERDPKPLILTGNAKFFSAGAELSEIQEIAGSSAVDFAQMGQDLMNRIARFPSTVYAAIHGYCMGGGLDLALACHRRIASAHAVFGHRGAALGLVTGWGGRQRLPRLVGKGRALAMLVAAEKLHAREAMAIGLIDAIADDPVAEAARRIASRQSSRR
jgi:enoyl-CoA hydratase/carnithine racemase